MNWNPEYIKGKKLLQTVVVGMAHNHAGGYYKEDCIGCVAENQQLNNQYLQIDIEKLKASSSSSNVNEK